MLFSSALFAAEGVLHVVRHGDTLSQIAQDNLRGRVYGRRGSLAKLLTLNPKLDQNGHIIVGQKIRLGTDAQPGWRESHMTPVAANENSHPRTPASEDGRLTTAAQGQTPEATVPSGPVALAPIQCAAPTESQSDIDHGAEFTVGYQFTTLQSTDGTSGATATLITDRDLNVGAAWKQVWTSGFRSFAAFNVRNVDFSAPTSSTKSLTNPSQTLLGLQMGVDHQIGERLQLKYSLGYGNQLFMHAVTANSLSVDSVAVPSAALAAHLRFFTVGKTSMGLNASATYLFSGTTDTYSVGSGTALDGALTLKREDQERTMGVALGYRDRSQSTSSLNVREDNIYGLIYYSMPLFRSRAPAAPATVTSSDSATVPAAAQPAPAAADPVNQAPATTRP